MGLVKFAAGFLAGCLFALFAHAQNLNSWQAPRPFNQNYKARTANNRGTLVARWTMGEASGNIVDSIGGVSLAPYGSEFYSADFGSAWDPGVLLFAAGQGFYKRSATTSLEPLTQSFRFRTVEWITVPSNEAFQVSYQTAVASTDVPGFEFAWNGTAAAKGRRFFIRDTAGNQADVTWSEAAITTAYNTGAAYEWEMDVNRVAGTATLYLNGVALSSKDISAVTGAVTSSGVGIGQDYRAGVGRNYQGVLLDFAQWHRPGIPLYDLWTAGANTTYLELFGEASGGLVDQVAGITMAAVGTSTYGVKNTGSWSRFTGITTGAASYFRTSTANAAFDLGASGLGDATVELLVKTTAAGGTILDFESKSSPYYGWVLYGGTTADELWIYGVCDNGTIVDQNIGYWNSWSNGATHKLRLVRDAAAQKLYLYQDGVLQYPPKAGQGYATIPSTCALTGRVRAVGATSAGTYITPGTYYGLKITHDKTTISSGE